MKTEKEKKTLPRLKGKGNFRRWKRAVEHHLGTKSILYLLKYDVQPYVQLLANAGDEESASEQSEIELDDTNTRASTISTDLPEVELEVEELPDSENEAEDYNNSVALTDDVDEDERTRRLRRAYQAIPRRLQNLNLENTLPNRVKNAVAQGKRIKVFHQHSRRVPDVLFKLTTAATLLIQIDHKLFVVFNDVDSYLEQRAKLIEDKQKVVSVISSTLSDNDEHLFEASKSPYQGYKKLCEQFVTDATLDQYQILAKIEALVYRDMDSYI